MTAMIKHTVKPLWYKGASVDKNENVATIPPALPKLIIHAVPILRSAWPRRFITYQHTIIGPPANAPMATRQMAAYCTEKW